MMFMLLLVKILIPALIIYVNVLINLPQQSDMLIERQRVVKAL
jgi:hypothetical protein